MPKLRHSSSVANAPLGRYFALALTGQSERLIAVEGDRSAQWFGKDDVSILYLKIQQRVVWSGHFLLTILVIRVLGQHQNQQSVKGNGKAYRTDPCRIEDLFGVFLK
jgi:hypothetical protein